MCQTSGKAKLCEDGFRPIEISAGGKRWGLVWAAAPALNQLATVVRAQSPCTHASFPLSTYDEFVLQNPDGP